MVNPPSSPRPSPEPNTEADRLAQPASTEGPPRLDFPVVGIGASAGGFEARASNEEPRSLNEELTTINTQLQGKMEELEATTNELASLLRSTDIAVIFLDSHFRIRRYTPAVSGLIDIIAADVGRPLRDLARKFTDDDLLIDADAVLKKRVPLEKEITSEAGRSYLRRILPYRTTDNRITGVVITFVDITERRQAQSALRETEHRHRLILQGITDYGILMLDGEGRIATWNAGAEAIFGFSSSEALGQSLALILPADAGAAQRAADELEEARRAGSVVEEGWHVRKNRSQFWGSGTLSVLTDEAGRPFGFVKVLRDQTERRMSEEALKQAKHAADAANESKDHFLATVSHELRTPLSSILLWTRLIQDQAAADPAQLTEALAAIQRSAEEQSDLIEDLVDMSRIVAGKLRLELKPVRVADVVHAGTVAAAGLSESKGITLEEHVDPNIGTVMADGARLKQVVSNLVNNGVKFTPAGGRVRVEAQRLRDEIRIAVTDTGIGIEPAFLSQVFDRFVQADRASTRTNSGLGLGLTIVRQIVEMHGGSIEVESPGLGRGSTFVVRMPLPVTGGQSPAPDLDTKVRLANLLRGREILLIEDVAATRRAIAAVLEQAGANVVAVDSAPAAWEAFEKRRPTIILSDLGLPSIDGYALMRQLRETEASLQQQSIPAVALTAFAGESVHRKALSSGFQACLVKPIDPFTLVATLAGFAPAPVDRG